MKLLWFAFFIVPLLSAGQKVRLNEYDKFIRQRRIELEPVVVHSAAKEKVSLSFSSLSSSFFVQLSGQGWGASTIDAGSQMIFLFSNDSVVTVGSVGLQTYEIGTEYNSYSHQYALRVRDIEALASHELVGLRKYNLKGYTDLKIGSDMAVKVRRLGSLFLHELKKADVLYALKRVELKNIDAHIGDSIAFFARLDGGRVIGPAGAENLVFSTHDRFSEHHLDVVIPAQDRPRFNHEPELMYGQKEVCISGILRLHNNMPQVVVHSQRQIRVTAPLSTEEAMLFIGDSITVEGLVYEDQPGMSSPGKRVLSVLSPLSEKKLVVEIDPEQTSMADYPANFFRNAAITVSGRLVMDQGQVKIAVDRPAQLTITKQPPVMPAVSGDREKPLPAADVVAQFPGGHKAWMEFLNNNLSCPKELEGGEKRTVVARFSVNEDGSLSHFSISRSGGRNFDQEVIRVLKMMPHWVPQMKNGKPVAVTFTQPVTFNGLDPLR